MELGDRPPAGPRGRIGAQAEAAAAAWLADLGWTILARNLRVDGVELDLLARDPTSALVVIEVRARSGPAFGAAVESVGAHKVARLYRAAAVLRRGGHPAVGNGPLSLPPRVDLVVLRRGPGSGWRVEEHLRGLAPP